MTETRFARMPMAAAGAGLTATDWAVLHVICMHIDKAGCAYPSLARIAQIAGIRRNHVSRSTKRLEELGLLRSRRLSRGSGWANTHYEVVFDAPEEMAPEPVAPDASIAPEVGAPRAPRVAPPVGPSIAKVAPEVVLGGTSSGTTGGTSDGALTIPVNYPSEQSLPRKEEVEEEEQRAGATNGGATCRWPLGDGCTRPTAPGKRLCVMHEARR